MSKYFPAVFLVFFSLFNFAQAECGDFVFVDGSGYEERTPIEDCANPFNEDETNPFDSSVFVNGVEVIDGGELALPLGEYLAFTAAVAPEPFLADFGLFKQDGEDMEVIDDYFNDGSSLTFSATGTYYLVLSVMMEPPILVLQESLIDKIISFIIPTAEAYYDDFLDVRVYEFTVIDEAVEEEEEEIDPLLLQYAPILYMHPEETYFPMNVESFIKDSALWEDGVQLRDVSGLSVQEFESIIESEDTSDMYLAYSNPDTDGAIDLNTAEQKYKDAVEAKEATTTVYVHRMNDSYTDSQGDTHYFTVLQYWYFYAMNNWGQTGGFNDHEGDWESVFVFLDNETDQPAYVAFSAHHNDGLDEFYNITQYESVRRGWGEVDRGGNSVSSFVSLGSHAMYPDPEDRQITTGIDKVSDSVYKLSNLKFSSFEPNNIFDYGGKWGSDTEKVGGDGPLSPKFSNVSGTKRFEEPIVWAGIDKIERMVLPEPSSQFDVSTVAFDFSEVVPLGTEFYVDEQNEVIVFGVIPQNVEMLPTFWDIESSLENGTFEATVSLPYDPELVQGMGLNEQQLSAMYYNPETVSWEVVPSEVDIENHLILFDTNHFSRYAIGIVEIDSTPTIEELFVELRVSIETADLRDKVKRHLVRRVDRIERIYESDNKRSGKIVERRLNSLVQEVKLLEWLFRVNLSEIDLSINKLKQGLGYD